MEPKIEINVIGVDDPLIKRRLKRIAKPDTGVGNIRPCLLCETETSWTVNNHPVCPLCQAKYGFVKKDWLPDLCEVCGTQGEWACGKEDQHSLCFRHRDAWMGWKKRDVLLEGYRELPEAEKDKVWEECFATFVQEMKAKQ